MCAGARRRPCRKRAGLVCKIIFWSQVPNKIPLFAVKWWQLMTENEKAEEAKPLEVVWVALYSVLVLMLMMLCVDVAAR